MPIIKHSYPMSCPYQGCKHSYSSPSCLHKKNTQLPPALFFTKGEKKSNLLYCQSSRRQIEPTQYCPSLWRKTVPQNVTHSGGKPSYPSYPTSMRKTHISWGTGPETNEIGTHICSCHNFFSLSSVQILLIPACCLLCVL